MTNRPLASVCAPRTGCAPSTTTLTPGIGRPASVVTRPTIRPVAGRAPSGGAKRADISSNILKPDRAENFSDNVGRVGQRGGIMASPSRRGRVRVEAVWRAAGCGERWRGTCADGGAVLQKVTKLIGCLGEKTTEGVPGPDCCQRRQIGRSTLKTSPSRRPPRPASIDGRGGRRTLAGTMDACAETSLRLDDLTTSAATSWPDFFGAVEESLPP